MKKIVALLVLFCWRLVLAEDLQDVLSCLRTYINSFEPKMEGKLFKMFKESYPNTLSTTIQHFDLSPHNESTYIITGDIEAMWLRDSTNQFLPYMKITENCPKIQQLARGLINTQAELIMTDGYTNAFKKYEKTGTQRHFYLNDQTQALFFGIPLDLSKHKQFATKSIWERKFQIDSLASFLRLAYEYSQRYSAIDFVDVRFLKALRRVMKVVEEQSLDAAYQRRKGVSFYSFYRTPTQLTGGHIKLAFRTGMVQTGFRPSDDPNDMAFNIPGNAMLSTYLQLVATNILQKIPQRSVLKSGAVVLANRMNKSSEKIRQAIFEFGVTEIKGKKVFAYEVNGKGESKIFDDANLPSLLSLPYLKFVKQDEEIYQNTRALILSTQNPYFFKNGDISGVGSSHTPQGNVWPLALITQVLTSNDTRQMANCLNSLRKHSSDNLMHQSFSVSNPRSQTRAWFAWANSLFGEMVINLSQHYPQLLK